MNEDNSFDRPSNLKKSASSPVVFRPEHMRASPVRQDLQPLEVETNMNPPPHQFGGDFRQPLVSSNGRGAEGEEEQLVEKKVTVDDIIRAIPFGRF